MPIFIKDIARATQAAKSLKRNLDDWFIKKPLTWHQETIALMLEHPSWKALSESVKEGRTPSPLDEEVEHDEMLRRRTYETQVLVDRLGNEAVELGVTPDTLRTIVDHVAPSGQPSGGTAFMSIEAELTEDGIVLPLSLDLWTEDALFFWKDIPSTTEFKHVTEVFDPEADAVHPLLDHSFSPEVLQRVLSIISSRPDDSLDKLTLLAHLSRVAGDLKKAGEIITEAYNIGSLTWAPVARERRRLHKPVQWWEEPNTRPFMRVLHEMATIDLLSGTDEGARSGFMMLQVIFALNPDDPLQVGKKLALGDHE